MFAEVTPLILFLATLQVVGLASACLARMSEGSRVQAQCHAAFMVCMCLLGVATAASLAVGPGWCMSCGLTLSIMAVGAVCDFSGTRAEVF
jgi:hypothetical protein